MTVIYLLFVSWCGPPISKNGFMNECIFRYGHLLPQGPSNMSGVGLGGRGMGGGGGLVPEICASSATISYNKDEVKIKNWEGGEKMD